MINFFIKKMSNFSLLQIWNEYDCDGSGYLEADELKVPIIDVLRKYIDGYQPHKAYLPLTKVLYTSLHYNITFQLQKNLIKV